MYIYIIYIYIYIYMKAKFEPSHHLWSGSNSPDYDESHINKNGWIRSKLAPNGARLSLFLDASCTL